MGQPQWELFGALLQIYRHAAGMTQHALAVAAGYSRVYIGMLERGERVPNATLTDRLALALGLSMSDRATLDAARAVFVSPQQGRAEDCDTVPLCGRSYEIHKLERHLQGNGRRLVLLAGEPGIGKTRLLQEALSRAHGKGWLVLSGICRTGDMHSFAPLEAPLGSLLRQLSLQKRNDFLSGSSGIRILLDDLHLASQEVLDTLVNVLRLPSVAHVICVGAYQSNHVKNGVLAPFLQEVAGTSLAERIVINPITLEESAQLFDAFMLGYSIAPDLREHAIARAEGIPGFLATFAHDFQSAARSTESAAERESLLPWEIEQGVLHRLTQLAPHTQLVIHIAAIADGAVDVALLVHALQSNGLTEDEALEAIEDAHAFGFLKVCPSPVGFARYALAHHVMREVIQANLRLTQHYVLARHIAAAKEYAYVQR